MAVLLRNNNWRNWGAVLHVNAQVMKIWTTVHSVWRLWTKLGLLHLYTLQIGTSALNSADFNTKISFNMIVASTYPKWNKLQIQKMEDANQSTEHHLMATP